MRWAGASNMENPFLLTRVFLFSFRQGLNERTQWNNEGTWAGRAHLGRTCVRSPILTLGLARERITDSEMQVAITETASGRVLRGTAIAAFLVSAVALFIFRKRLRSIRHLHVRANGCWRG